MSGIFRRRLLLTKAPVSITGTLSQTLANATLVATGQLTIAGALVQTLDDASLSAAGELTIEGVAVVTLDDASLNADGELAIAGALSQTLEDASLSATGALEIKGEAASTLEDASLTATGELPITGSLSTTLDDATLAAAGEIAIEGTLSQTLENASLSAAGTLAIEGTVSQTLEDAVLDATAALAIEGTVNSTLDDATLEATGGSATGGVLNVILDDAVLEATGELPIAGVLSGLLEDASLAATGELNITGAVNATLADATLAAAGALAIVGVLNATLEDATLEAAGGEPAPILGTLAVTLEDASLFAQGADISDLIPDAIRIRHMYHLETFRSEIGYHPYHFYQQANNTIPVNSECNTLVMKYSWQNTMMAGREDIRDAIAVAKQKLRDYLGFRVSLDYVTREIRYPRPDDARMSYGRPADTLSRYLSVNVSEGYIKEVGAETFATIQAAASVTYTDANGDGVNDTATVILLGVSGVGVDEVACYFADADRPDGSVGADEKWKIEPTAVSFSGTTLTIKFPSWVLVKPILLDGVVQAGIDPNDTTKFANTIQVYRRYTNPNGDTTDTSQAVLIWEANPPPWAICSPDNPIISTDPAAVGVAVARAGIRDARTGEIITGTAVLNSGAWTGMNWGAYQQPDRVKIRYLAGADLREVTETNISSTDWKGIITRLAVSELAQHICACDDANRYIKYWSEDLARISGNADQLFRITERDLENPFGTRRGHVYAWKRVRHLAISRAFVI